MVCSDAGQFAVAAFVGTRLAQLNTRADTDVILVSDSQPDLVKAASLGERFRLYAFAAARFAPRLLPGLMHGIFFRYFMPELLVGAYRRILYLDTDIYPQDSRLYDLFDLDLGGRALAGVRDLLELFPGHGDRKELIDTGRDKDRKYLNTGVMLIDIDAYLRDGLTERFCAVLNERQRALLYPDQSTFNIAVDGNWVELSPAFNMLPAEYELVVREAFPPVVVHFAGSVKPWHGPKFQLDHPARKELETFLAGSPWKGFLARYFDFSAAWKAAGEAQPDAGKSWFDNGMIDRQMAIAHLTGTDFADVRAGIVDCRLDALRGRAV